MLNGKNKAHRTLLQLQDHTENEGYTYNPIMKCGHIRKDPPNNMRLEKTDLVVKAPEFVNSITDFWNVKNALSVHFLNTLLPN
jgi:hypothetical protein